MQFKSLLYQFIELHYEDLLAYARKAAHQDEEDASEAVYRSLYSSPSSQLKDLKDISRIPGWLYRSIRDDVIDIRRHRFNLDKNGLVRMQPTSLEELVEHPDSTTGAIKAEDQSIFETLKECWYRLSESQRAVLEICHLPEQTMPLEEAASQLGMSYDNIRSYSSRGIKRLRECLALKGITSRRHLF